MKRNMVVIDEDKCIGCGLCIMGCAEGALQLIDGKAKLISDSYCDGLGACLPSCPVDAISIEEREADPFDEEAAQIRMEKASTNTFSCPGFASKSFEKKEIPIAATHMNIQSELRQWPCQIKLIPENAPYFENSHLLIAADCSAYAYANFHQEFIKNKITIIGCPKLDSVDYSEKLTSILANNNIKSVTVVRMEVPCCGGLENAAKIALRDCGKMIPWSITTISTEGDILDI